MKNEEIGIWSGTPSQVTNVGVFILGVFTIVLLPVTLWYWLAVKNTKYELTNQRLKTSKGILNIKTEELELYRVKDSSVDRPIFLRMFSLGNVKLETSDKSNPVVIIKAIPDPDKLRENIRNAVEERRDQKRVREVDYE